MLDARLISRINAMYGPPPPAPPPPPRPLPPACERKACDWYADPDTGAIAIFTDDVSDKQARTLARKALVAGAPWVVYLPLVTSPEAIARALAPRGDA